MPSSYDLPSLGDLACFEAAARHLSFKEAASELNVTPAAVSHRIKALEFELTQPLFLRRYRGVELTEAGTLLFVALQRGFTTISECVSRIRNSQDETGVAIASTSAVSGLWLTQFLALFLENNPDISVSQIVQDSGTPPGPDLSIVYGDPNEEHDETRHLFRGRIVALGTRKFLENHKITNVLDLLSVPLIHTQTSNSTRTEWAEWFDAFGATLPGGPRYSLNNYLISLQAAENHIGAVLGWESLLTEYMKNDRLIQLVPESIESPYPFYLRIHSGASENARLFADWLVERLVPDQARATPS
ncbi:DNA-binding transcriptional regulator, LysR family [Cohaesibacter sp. ES.047]|uniref:LysR substrate-binding domain-containing protein n=1 Tax=Cohaesibacter sp. ES.047 TaxID=1798205 RepID=UPI000BB963A5|nr:LysR substrate-binding domain-containing protein [Cohaesibacter sp. ES.047]SNY94114.1 DNA-binding transcriptional regulator, LysR family [Cohaesibacter sp. ES.047]